MKILTVHAHENPNSFCSALANITQTQFSNAGHTALISDLYAEAFNPVGGKHDFKLLNEDAYYKYASQQLHASTHDQFQDNLAKEMQKLIDADILNFNFPLWWFGFPAILKGWVDRIMAYGLAYGGEYGFGDKGRFKGRRAFLTVTTGSPESNYSPTGSNKRPLSEIFRNINEGIFELVGYEVVEPFIAYGVSRISQEERENILKEYETYLKTNFL